MSDRDYLVIYEETDPDGLPTDDGLVLDIESGKSPNLGELDVEQNVSLELSNTRNRVGTAGFSLACLGSALGVGLMGAFAWSYPGDWYSVSGRVAQSGLVQNLILLSILCLLLLVAGTVLTHYGRRIQARGNLSRVRIVEKTPHARARFE